MKKAIIGKKIGMTQLFDERGNVVPVTAVEAGPCIVTQKKTLENDGYEAVQVGFGELKASKVNKPMAGHFAKNDVAPKKFLREFRLEDIAAVNVGDLIKADAFAAGEAVDVTGTSKGKGTAGVIKRWNFSRLKKPTVPALFIVMPVLKALVPLPPVYSREPKVQVVWVVNV